MLDSSLAILFNRAQGFKVEVWYVLMHSGEETPLMAELTTCDKDLLWSLLDSSLAIPLNRAQGLKLQKRVAS